MAGADGLESGPGAMELEPRPGPGAGLPTVGEACPGHPRRPAMSAGWMSFIKALPGGDEAAGEFLLGPSLTLG
eukprot:16435836-Heterocapsa_arctica.AAC.1